MAEMERQRVSLGELVLTDQVQRDLVPADVFGALARHQRGDWGELDSHDRAVNNAALQTKDRVLSVYQDSRGTRFYIITDPGWQKTTVLLPEEY